MQGTIKSLVSDRKFGFIAPEDGSKDIFFHATSLSGVEYSQLAEGDKVSFDVEQADKGPRAINVARG